MVSYQTAPILIRRVSCGCSSVYCDASLLSGWASLAIYSCSLFKLFRPEYLQSHDCSLELRRIVMCYAVQSQLESKMAQDESRANVSVGYGKKNTILETVRRSKGKSQARRSYSLDGAQ